MRNYAESLREQMEADLAWRTDEIRFLQNTLSNVAGSDQDRLRRALMLLLYAHFEGFCKFALDSYVSAINQLDIKCSYAVAAIAAASLHEIFDSLKKQQKKSELFTTHSALDAGLHSFARDVEFVEKSKKIYSRVVNIPDSVVKTESNLWPEVLRKNLFRLGLPIDCLEIHENRISGLVMLRNKIAHGEFKRGIKDVTYVRVRDSTLMVMGDVMRLVYDSLRSRAYLKELYRSGSLKRVRTKGLIQARRLAS